MKFNGKVLVIGLGAVSRCTLPLLFKHLQMDRKRITVMDFADVGEAAKEVIAAGANFVQAKITPRFPIAMSRTTSAGILRS